MCSLADCGFFGFEPEVFPRVSSLAGWPMNTGGGRRGAVTVGLLPSLDVAGSSTFSFPLGFSTSSSCGYMARFLSTIRESSGRKVASCEVDSSSFVVEELAISAPTLDPVLFVNDDCAEARSLRVRAVSVCERSRPPSTWLSAVISSIIFICLAPSIGHDWRVSADACSMFPIDSNLATLLFCLFFLLLAQYPAFLFCDFRVLTVSESLLLSGAGW